jgi:hypothetical protein
MFCFFCVECHMETPLEPKAFKEGGDMEETDLERE